MVYFQHIFLNFLVWLATVLCLLLFSFLDMDDLCLFQFCFKEVQIKRLDYLLF